MSTTKKSADALKLKNIVHRAVTLVADTAVDVAYGDFSAIAHYASVAHTVAEIVPGLNRDDLNVLIASAYLHDFIEDIKSNSYYDLKVGFGKVVADIVWALSGFGRNRDERLLDKFKKIEKTPVAYAVFAADRISNLRAAIEAGDKNKIAMYIEEHDKVVELTSALLNSAAVPARSSDRPESLIIGSETIDGWFIAQWFEAYKAVIVPAVAARAKRKAREAKKPKTSK